MQSIENKILTSVKKCGRGTICFASDFIRYGSAASVRKALSTLVASGTFVRVAQGIYLYPKTNPYISGPVLPSLDEIARAIAKRDKVHIQPVADYALNLLGLSTQLPQNAVYLTDGAARRIKVYDGHGIRFVRTTPKNLLYKEPLIGMAVSAIREIGEGKLTDEEYRKIKDIVTEKVEKETALTELRLAPIWVRETILKMYE